jgi:uncharacterized membrane protein/putative flippase GtrA
VRRPSIQAILTAAVVAVSAGFVLTRLEPSLLFANTTPSGGDMGAHVWAPAYLRDHLLPRFQLTGWTPDWYAGFPAFTFYFPLPSLLIVLLDLLVPYGVAFKLVSVLGAVTLPVAAYAFGRLSSLRFPGPPLLAVAVLPFLFDTSFTIYGGNIPSLLAGEFAFSLSLSLALVFLGVLVRGLETGRHRALAALLLALIVLSHAIPALFAIGAAAVLLILRLDRHRLRYVATVMLVAAMLTAFWSLPFVFRLAFTNDLGWVKITDYLKTLFPPHIRWILPLAGAGLIGAIGMRLHSGVAIAAMGMLAGVAFVVAPEGRIWNARLLPFWFLCLYLLAGVGVSEVGRALGGVFARDPDRPASWPALATPLIAFVGTLAVVGGPLRTLPSWLPVRPGQESFVPDWVRWNFSGYEGKVAHPEYRALIETMGRLPCGRAMWEYGPELNRYGTPMALMLLPYWTKGCIGSMEGLFFESSGTTPFHFLNQSELSKQPSRPQRDLPYQDLNVALGVKHLQLLGVRYYLAASPEALAQARLDPNLLPVASSGPWEIFEVANASLVSPLSYEPVVVNGIGNSAGKWLPVALPFYMSPESWDVFLAGAGPKRWARVDRQDPIPRLPVRPAEITRIRSSDNRIAFDVDRPGSPVLVKASYFPNWKARGADGPWRVAPNLMVVIPTARTVELYYGYTPVDIAGWLLTLLGLVGVVLLSRRALQFPEPPGIERFRRFAAITTLVTAIDFGILLFLRLQFGVPLLVADAVSISMAATASYLLHRSITFGDDPHIRWVREPFNFVAVTGAAGLIDLVVLGAAAGLLGSTATIPLLAAKSLAVAAAGALRLAAYRRRLFVEVREVQATPALRPEPPGELRLSVVVPAFNEGNRIAGTIGGIRAALADAVGNGLEIIVVDDGSDDDTAEHARGAGADRVIVLPDNRGKGAAVRGGALAARGRVVAFTDADLSYSPEQLLTFLAEVEAGWDAVVGTRKHIKTSTLIRAARLRDVSGRIFNLLTRALLLGQYRDTQCGIKAFRSDVARLLFSKSRLERFAFDVEIFHLAERYRLSLTEVPVTVSHTERSTVHVAVDAAKMIWDIFRVRRYAGEGRYDLLPEDRPLPTMVGSKAELSAVETPPAERKEQQSPESSATDGQWFVPFGLLVAVALGVWITKGAWGADPLEGDDVIFHLIRADFGIEHLVAKGRLDGWFPRLMLGHQMFLVYGPGFTWLLALMRGVTLGSLSNEGAMSLVAVGSFTALPLTVAFAARSFGLTRRAGVIAGILSLGVSNSFGLGVQATFGIGLIPNQVAAVIFFFCLGSLLRLLDEPDRRWMVLASSSLALLLVTHLISVMVLAVLLPICVALRLAVSRFSWKLVGQLALTATGAALLAAFWLIPLIAHLDLLGPAATWATPPLLQRLGEIFRGEILFRSPVGEVVAIGLVACLVAAARGWKPGAVIAVAPIAYLVVAHTALELPFGGGVTLQLANRGLGYVGVIALFPVAAGIAYATDLGKVGDLSAWAGAAFLVLLSLGPLAELPQGMSKPRSEMREAAKQLARLVPDGARFATERDFPAEIDRTGVVHPEMWLARASGRNTLNVFLPESSPSPAGFEPDQLGRKPVEESADSLARFGVTHVVTTSEDLGRRLADSSRFEEVWKAGSLAIFRTIPLLGQPEPSSLLSSKGGPLSARLLEAAPEHPRFEYEAPDATPGEIAISWSPKWRASIDGQPVPLHRTRDGMLAVDLPPGRHRISIDFGPDAWDWIGRFVTLATIGGLLLLMRRRISTASLIEAPAHRERATRSG